MSVLTTVCIQPSTKKKQKKQEGQDGPVSLTWLTDKFWVNWPFCSQEKVKYWFLRWRPSWISNQNNFSYFWSTSHFDTSNEVWVNCPFGSGEKVQNRFSWNIVQWPTFTFRSTIQSYWFIIETNDVHTSINIQDIRQNHQIMKYKSRWPNFFIMSILVSHRTNIPSITLIHETVVKI